jgi:hypothetical protein
MSQSKKNGKKHINAGSHGNALISGSGPGTPTKSTPSPVSSSGGATPTNLFGSTSSIIGQLKDGLKSMKDNEGKLGGVTEERDTKVPVNSKRRKYKKRKQPPPVSSGNAKNTNINIDEGVSDDGESSDSDSDQDVSNTSDSSDGDWDDSKGLVNKTMGNIMEYHRGNVKTWIKSINFENIRNQKEAESIAFAVDVFMKEVPTHRSTKTFDVLMRRLIGVYLADANNSWDYCDAVASESLSVIPREEMFTISKQVEKIRKAKQNNNRNVNVKKGSHYQNVNGYNGNSNKNKTIKAAPEPGSRGKPQ